MQNFDPDCIQLNFKCYHIIATLFVFCFVISNILAVKITHIGLLIFPAGVILFPLSYVFSDILTEVYGFQRARQLIWLAIFCNILFVFFSWITLQLPTAPGWTIQQQAYQHVFDFEWRFLLASSISYFTGDYFNCVVLAKLKLINQSRFIWIRFIISTALGTAIDNTLFSIIAFFGKMPIHDLIWIALSQYIIKVSYEALMSPISVNVSQWLKKIEKTNIYDFNTNFTPFQFTVSYTAENNKSSTPP